MGRGVVRWGAVVRGGARCGTIYLYVFVVGVCVGVLALPDPAGGIELAERVDLVAAVKKVNS